ncbi:VPLPA-CTERM sorting domain-containing protein [Parasedimentitalea denitrificans]|uniref:VPLPA-CTERM sorting domain-containing protein n=1 Tax=Parasedimentitalea denitrificans TaxID=2211118 RepID=UPI001F0DDB43|nr:VPLPA-CTERM sorting domain-containing protein [Sedimentitalea sp. CY04]
MNKILKTTKAIALGAVTTAFLASSAYAATVGSAATGSASVGGFVMNGGQAMVDVSNGAYTSVPGDTSPESTWVWDEAGSQSVNTTNTFVWTFDLTGYDLTTAVLTGLWGVDNFGTASLNGAVIGTIDFGFDAFQTLEAVSDGTNTPVFVAGINTLSFSATNGYQSGSGNPGPGAFRTGVTVTADVSPVPLPAAGLLLIGALGGLGLMRRRKKS